MTRVRFDASEVLRRAGTEYPGVQSAAALIPQLQHVLEAVNVELAGERMELKCEKTTDPAGLGFEIVLNKW